MYDDFSLIYDELMKSQVDYKFISKNIINIMEDFEKKKIDILECAMGSGNLTRELLKYNVTIDGFDISENMLSIAHNKLIGEKNINIFKGDIRTFTNKRSYDLICCFFDVINYLKTKKDIRLFLKNMTNKMHNNSLLMFDINTEYKLREYLGNNTFAVEENKIFYTWENFLYSTFIDFRINFFVKTENNFYRRITENQRQYIYTENEIETLIEECSLKIYKKLDFDTFDDIKSKCYRVLYIVKK